MKTITLLLGALLFLRAEALADCGGEEWGLPQAEISKQLPFDTKSILMVGLSSGAPDALTTQVQIGAGWGPGRKISTSEFIPVSRMPSCNNPKHALEGDRLPIVASSGAFVKIIYNAKTGDSVWLLSKDLKPFILDLSSIPAHTYLTSAFSPETRKEIRVYPFPEESNIYTLLPEGHAVFQIYEQNGDFVRLMHTKLVNGAWETAPVGWIRLRSTEGELLLWPWYADDC